MTSYTLNASFWSTFCELALNLATRANLSQAIDADPGDRSADRDLVNEALWKNPESVSSDFDVQVMMDMYSGRS